MPVHKRGLTEVYDKRRLGCSSEEDLSLPPTYAHNGNRLGWGGVEDLPFSKAYYYKLYPALSEAGVGMVILRAPGSRKSRRLIDLDALNAFLIRLAAEQRQQSQEAVGK